MKADEAPVPEKVDAGPPPSPLSSFIESQEDMLGGAVIALFTSELLAKADLGPVHPLAARVRDELGMGLTDPGLFSYEAYVMQSCLGERWLE